MEPSLPATEADVGAGHMEGMVRVAIAPSRLFFGRTDCKLLATAYKQ